MERIRVIVVDDHSVVRMGLRAVLADQEDMELVAEGESGSQAGTLVDQWRPDVLVMDLALPGGLELIREIRRNSRSTEVLVLTMHEKEMGMLDALSAGAAGYLLKESTHRLIPLAIRSLAAGGSLIEKRLLNQLVRLASQARRSTQETQPTSSLSERELAVLRLISQGSSNRVIGERLYLAEATVKKYVHSLKSKLSVSDRAEAAVVGLRLGLLE